MERCIGREEERGVQGKMKEDMDGKEGRGVREAKGGREGASGREARQRREGGTGRREGSEDEGDKCGGQKIMI